MSVINLSNRLGFIGVSVSEPHIDLDEFAMYIYGTSYHKLPAAHTLHIIVIR